MGWQRRSGYNRRSLVETAMYRYKTIIGRRLLARTLSSQQVEAKIGCTVLNRIDKLRYASNHPDPVDASTGFFKPPARAMFAQQSAWTREAAHV